METPWPGVAILGLYLMFVLKWGPKWMEHRKPMKIDNFIKVYNLVQVILCLFLVVEVACADYSRKGLH